MKQQGGGSMTSARQRVSDEKLAQSLTPFEAFSDHDGVSVCIKIARDLRDARVDLQRVMAENAELRAALATARRDGWIAGRDAAAECVDRYLHQYGLTFSWHRDVPEAIRALAPDTAEGESDG